MYEVADDESCADIVLTVDLHIPDVYTHTYEFPIRARLYVDTGKGMTIHGGSIGGISADNPFNGTGFNGGVNVFEITATSVTVSAGFYWTNSKHERGELKQDLKLPYGKPLSVRLPDGSAIEISWREPAEKPPDTVRHVPAAGAFSSLESGLVQSTRPPAAARSSKGFAKSLSPARRKRV
jgi:hypothetical protein